MRNICTLIGRCILPGAIAIVPLALAADAAGKEPYKGKVRYSFCAQNSCTDGEEPEAGLIADAQGNLYGTTAFGANNGGTVFKVTPGGVETVLYSFCSKGQDSCTDGAISYAGLIADAQGNLYGTTGFGGAFNGGTVFKVTPKGTEKVVYSFCSTGGDNCTDGEEPEAGLVADAQGNLYGTTFQGGAYGGGTVFEVIPNGTEKVLYSFCAQADCADGDAPDTGLILDDQGNLFGTTTSGGTPGEGEGTVFEVMANGTEKVLYSFCAQGDCADGDDPEAGLIADSHGNLFGTTETGGTYGEGVVFKVTPKGMEKVLYSFCAQANCPDGQKPRAGLIADAQGNLYGTTPFGGAHDGGTVFEVTPAGTETVLYSFRGFDAPLAGLIADTHGNLFGTTASGGAFDGGTVFEAKKRP